MMRDYPIKRPIDEATCESCGGPLAVGDVAVEELDRLFCSEACAPECRPGDWLPAAGLADDYPD